MTRVDRVAAQKRLRLKAAALAAQDRIDASREKLRQVRAELKGMSGRKRNG